MKRIFSKYGIVAMCCLLLSSTSVLQASGARRWQQQQGDESKRASNIEVLKIAFITKNLNLTTDEAQKFWPVYNSYNNDLAALRKNFGIGNGTDIAVEQQMDFEQKKLDLKKRYIPQFEAAIGKEKTNILYNLEEKFRQKLKEMQQQRQQQRGAGGGPGRWGPR